ncbi:MAG: Na+/H+ antiporter subunit E [Methyloligellaceae bacterium]
MEANSRGMYFRFFSLAAFLFLFWLPLSGHYTAFLIGLGILSALGSAYIARRMGIIDVEGHPVHLMTGALTYFPWLIWEILKSAVSVSLKILHPKLPISPTMVRVTASQKTPLGINIYGNSITLTPGTITVGVKGDQLTVHAITRDGAEELAWGAMDGRVTTFEGES